MIDGQPHTIVGVLAPTFAVPFMDAHIFTPLYANPEPQPRAPPLSVQAVAELAPGATVAQVREELASINRQLAQEYPRTHTGWLARRGAGPRMAIRIDACAVADVARGDRVRALDRVREHRQPDLGAGDCAIGRARASPGARCHRRATCCACHLAELLIVCVSGLIPGLLLASAAVPALLAINPTIARALGVVEIDWRVQLFSVVVAMLTAIGASAVPAIRAMRGQMSAAMSRSASRTTASPGPSGCSAPWSPSRSRCAWRC